MRQAALLGALAAVGLGAQQASYQSRPEQLPREIAEQPVPFSHRIHAAHNLACLDCHPGAETGQRAGLPDAEKCLLCHRTIAADEPAIKRLTAKAASGEALEWVRAYDVPGLVFFSHKKHVGAGLTCIECHGPVAERDVVAQEVSTSMTSCMNCHAERGVINECFICHDLGQ